MKYLVMAATLAIGVYGCSHAEPAERWALPNPALTPGSVASTDAHEICQRGYATEHRVWPYPEGKRNTLARYGIPERYARFYQDDDLIPLEVGGNNGDANNHWAEPRGQARIKDRDEDEMHAEVCSGQITPEQAQEYFRFNGWATGSPGATSHQALPR